MNIFAFIICGLLALVQGETNNKTSGYRQGKIIHGWNAAPGERPYQVSLISADSGSHFCGGAILNKFWVVTAAHCVEEEKYFSFVIIAGTIDLMKPQSTHLVRKIIIHKAFNWEGSLGNDIALIKVVEPFNFSIRLDSPRFANGRKSPEFLIKPVDLWTEFKVLGNALVSGWGFTENEREPKMLKVAEVYIPSLDECRSTMRSKGQHIYTSEICANNPYKREGHCSGDSGGPLTVVEKGVEKLVGIVSWSNKHYGCASPQVFNIYTRVSDYVYWINGIIESQDN